MLYQKVCADCGTPLSVLTIFSRFGCLMPRRSVLGTEKVFKLPFSRKKVQKSWQWYSFLRGRILCNVTHAASFFELNLNYTFHKRHFNSGWWFCACFFWKWNIWSADRFNVVVRLFTKLDEVIKSGSSACFANWFFKFLMYCVYFHECVTLLLVFDSYSFWPPCIYTLSQTIWQTPIFILAATVICP